MRALVKEYARAGGHFQVLSAVTIWTGAFERRASPVWLVKFNTDWSGLDVRATVHDLGRMKDHASKPQEYMGWAIVAIALVHFAVTFIDYDRPSLRAL